MTARSPAFATRTAAGQALGQRLATLALPAPIVVLALPRGGVPVAVEIARSLRAPLDLLMVRKIGAPWQPELAVAAVVEGTPPEIQYDEDTMALAGVDRDYVQREASLALQEIERRRQLYLQGRISPPQQGATVIVVDDGVATGTTLRAALRALRRRLPVRLVLAVPVAPHDTLTALRQEVDEVVCLATPSPFDAVGAHYDDFHQVSDDEVLAALRAA